RNDTNATNVRLVIEREGPNPYAQDQRERIFLEVLNVLLKRQRRSLDERRGVKPTSVRNIGLPGTVPDPIAELRDVPAALVCDGECRLAMGDSDSKIIEYPNPTASADSNPLGRFRSVSRSPERQIVSVT